MARTAKKMVAKKTTTKTSTKTTARKMTSKRPPRSALHNRKISEGMVRHFARKKRAEKKAAKSRRK